MRVDIPGIGGSLGECVICGKSFVKEVMLGQSVDCVRVTGINANLPVHAKCGQELVAKTDGAWETLPDGPLRREFEEAARLAPTGRTNAEEEGRCK